jgi:hypothetical protein
MSICILADAADIDRAKQIDLEYMSVDDLKKCVLCFDEPETTSDETILAYLQAKQEQKTCQEAREEV